MATLVATRHNPAIRRFYERPVNAGKLRTVALIAAMRTFTAILNARARDQESFTLNTPHPVDNEDGYSGHSDFSGWTG